jgi:hypothetical protein
MDVFSSWTSRRPRQTYVRMSADHLYRPLESNRRYIR